MRLIDADGLKGKAFADPDDGEHFVYCQDIDEAQTVDAVPVIRCRECENWKPNGSKAARKIGDPLERHGWCEVCGGGRLESDFCSLGKRREAKE